MRDAFDRNPEGPRERFQSLYNATADAVYAYLLSLTGEEGAALDAFQECYAAVFRQLDRCLAADSPRAYLFRIARNQAANLRRRRATSEFGQAALKLVVAPEPERSDGRGEAANEALASLPDELRELVVLKIYGELTFPDIARAINAPEGTVKARYYLALRTLKEILHAKRT